MPSEQFAKAVQHIDVDQIEEIVAKGTAWANQIVHPDRRGSSLGGRATLALQAALREMVDAARSARAALELIRGPKSAACSGCGRGVRELPLDGPQAWICDSCLEKELT